MASEAPGAVVSALALRRALLVVRRFTLADVARAWRVVVPAELAATTAAFALVAAVAVLTGQRAAVRLADVWFARRLGLPPAGLDPAPFLGLRDTEAPLPAVLASSGAYVRRALDRGHDEPLALASGLYRAERLASTEVTRAGTEAVAELATRSGSAGWRRLPGPGACEVCRGLADGSLQPWSAKVAAHPHCSCMPEPVLITR